MSSKVLVTTAGAYRSSAMEREPISKNGMSPKNHTNRRKWNMRVIPIMLMMCFVGTAWSQTTYNRQLGTTYSETVESGSYNRYAFSVTKEGMLTVNISTDGSAAALPYQGATFRLLNSSGETLKTFLTPTGFPYSDDYSIASIGDYQIEISSEYGGTFKMRADCFVDDAEPNNTIATAMLLPNNGCTVSGTLTSSDVDMYKYVLTQPGRFTVKVERGTMPNYVPVVQWLDSIGSQIESSGSYNSSYNTSMDLEAGTYYIKLNGSYTGTYTLIGTFTAAENNEIEPNNTTTDAQSLTLGQTVKGFFSYQDNSDMYRYVLTQPGRFTVKVERGTMANYVPAVQWLDSIGSQIESSGSYNSSYNTAMDLEAGTYYIKLNKYYTGTYTLTGTFTAAGNNETEPNSIRPEAQSLTFGQTVKGFLSYQDNIDMYKYVLTEPGRFTLKVERGTMGNYVPVVRWLESDGSLITSSGSYNSSYNGYKDLEAGIYYIELNKYYTGTYTLTGTIRYANAATPTITEQPVGATYTHNATATVLSVTATTDDDGTLTYQWYRHTTNSTTGGISVGTDSTYTPPTTSVGTYYYYVEVTNTNNSVTGTKRVSVTSNAVAVEVTATITPPTVTTLAATNITQTTATLNKSVTAGSETITAQGFKYKQSSASSWTTSASSSLTGLTAGTQYQFYAYATTATGTTNGSTLTFTTAAATITPPTVTTLAATSITQTSATLNKSVTAGSETITAQGFKYKQSSASSWTTSTTGSLTGLTASTQYQFYAYATTASGTTNSSTLTFTTTAATITPPTVTTLAATNIAQTTATLNKSVAAGSETITAQGFKYKQSSASTWTTSTSGSLTSLTANTQYEFYAYATTASGTINGTTLMFTTARPAGETAETITWQIGTPNAADVIATLNLADSTLTISGTGAMKDFTNSSSSRPWYSHLYVFTIKTVVIEDGVTTIGQSAFEYCSGITAVTIPNSITDIGASAFFNCNGLTSIMIPESVATIGICAFSSCYGLTSINVSTNNQYYSSLNGVLFNKNKTTLLQYPTGKTGGGYTIPNSVTTIGIEAFRGCDDLTLITIPNSVTTIERAAFMSCGGLISITIPNSVTNIGDDAFFNCDGLTSITIPEGVTSIGSIAFQNCDGLTSITIPNSVTKIGGAAFALCSGLTDVTVNWATPLSISSTVFHSDTLSNITLHVPCNTYALYAAAPVWQEFNIVEDVNVSATGVTLNQSTASLAVGNTLQLTKTVLPSTACNQNVTWASTDNNVATVANGLVTAVNTGTCAIIATTQEGNFMAYCNVTVTIAVTPPTVTTLAATSITQTTATLNKSVTSGSETITAQGFKYKQASASSWTTSASGSLTSLTAGTQYQFYAYATTASGTTNGDTLTFTTTNQVSWEIGTPNAADVIATLNLTDSTLTISGTGAMQDYDGNDNNYAPWYSSYQSKIKTVVIENGVTTIGNWAFLGCYNLTSLSIGNSVETIGHRSFESCSALTSVTIPNSVTRIEWLAFCSTGLISVDIPSTVTTISIGGNGVFESCQSLININVAPTNPNYSSLDGVLFNKDKTIIICYPGGKTGGYTIPNSVTDIEGAFIHHRRITSVNIPNSINHFGGVDFSGCYNLTDVTVNWATPLVTMPSAIGGSPFYGLDLSNMNLHVPCNTYALYAAAPAWQEFNIIEDVNVSATGVTLNQSTASLSVGNTLQLTKTVLPNTACNQNVSWLSTDNNVATVANGLVTAVNTGVCAIIATTQEGNFMAYCNVTVTIAVTPPTVTTLAATNITSISATLNKSVTAGSETITAQGFKYKQPSASSWTTSASGNLTGLTAGTQYQFYAYVTTATGTINGSTLTFTTTIAPPTVTTLAATNIAQTTATLNKSVTAGSETITAQGFKYKQSSASSWTTSASGNLTGLTAGTQYQFYAYATTASGTTNGSTLTFTTTIAPPTVTTLAATSITQTTATLNKSVTAGSETITAQGFKYKQSSASSWTTSTSGNITGLTANTQYQFYAYATTASGTTNGSTLTFTTSSATGIAESSSVQLLIYPNPVVNGELRIENGDLLIENGELRVEIYNVNGVLVAARRALPLQGGNITIDISHLPAGEYIVKVGNRTAKVVKK
ncbi:hypothetical protein FACS1894201_00100 [Bacteroidia bacterium]|nr:hypothetical protein FACS1894201_00100 [Bacteroidia bacterium]